VSQLVDPAWFVEVDAVAVRPNPGPIVPRKMRPTPRCNIKRLSSRGQSRTFSRMRHTVACCVALLWSQAALASDAVQVENGTVVEGGQLDLSGAGTLVVPRSAKITKTERADIEISARKQLGFNGQPPRSMLMAQWREYLGVMSCRDGERMYVFPYGEWDAQPENKKRKKRAGAGPAPGGSGASVRLRLEVPLTVQVITNSLPPKQGPCSAKYPDPFDEDSLKESYWYTHTAPPPTWARVELTEGAAGKRKRQQAPAQ
jgi:hypothetical protein